MSWLDYKLRIPAVFYIFINGPWRTLLVRHGYDPRLPSNKKDSCSFQIIEFHLNNQQAKELKIRSKANRTLELQHAPMLQNKMNVDVENYIFSSSMCHFLIPPQKLHFIYQLCFMKHKSIQTILTKAQKQISRIKVDQINGWLNAKDFQKIRKEMRYIIQHWIKKIKKEGFQWIKIIDKIFIEVENKKNY